MNKDVAVRDILDAEKWHLKGKQVRRSFMHLKKRVLNISKAVFDEKTYVEDGFLHINKQELVDQLQDFNFKSIDVELVHPGERCRINNVADCVQPMYKLGKGASTFPGVVDDIKRVGTGETVVLRGISVTEVALRPLKISSILDMFGFNADLSLTVPKMVQVCLLAEPTDGVTDNEYFNSLNIASKKAAKYLAQCAADCAPDSVEEFCLAEDVDPNLPKVVYVFQIFSHAPLTDTVYYGDGCASMLPIVVHPNEVLDGALLFRDYYQTCNASPSCVYQEHPMILELMRRHGKDINFAGLIISNTPAEVANKRRNAMMCAGLAKYHFHADCAIVTKEGGGHPQIDTGLNCDALEELGIKTVLVLAEMLSAGSPVTELVLFSTKNANAMVTTGCIDNVHSFEKPDRLVGLKTLFSHTGVINAEEAFEMTEMRMQRDVLNQVGNTNLISVEY